VLTRVGPEPEEAFCRHQDDFSQADCIFREWKDSFSLTPAVDRIAEDQFYLATAGPTPAAEISARGEPTLLQTCENNRPYSGVFRVSI
jgi:hypothetical protein